MEATVWSRPALLNQERVIASLFQMKDTVFIGQALLTAALFAAPQRLAADEFTVPFSGTVYLKLANKSGSADSQLGIGTSPSNCRFAVSSRSPTPTSEIAAGTFQAGSIVSFCMYSRLNNMSEWAFSSGNDRPSAVAFSDTDNSLRLGGRVIQQNGGSSWTMHLDDALSYLYDDDDDDLVVTIRVEPSNTPTGLTTLDFEPPLPIGLRPNSSFINGATVAQDARITSQYQNRGIVISGAALVALGNGHATSGANGIAPVDTSGRIDYRSPITYTFVESSGARGSVDFFSISTDKAGGSRNTIRLMAYGPGGNLLTSASFLDLTGGEQLTLRGIGFFESVTVQMITGDPGSSGVAFDLLAFGPITASGGQQRISSSVSEVGFSYRVGGAPPAPQQISISSNGGALPIVVSTSGGSWLRAMSNSSVTPAIITLSADANGLGPGAYSANLLVTASSAINPINTIKVNLNVTADAPAFSSAGIVNAASFARGLVPGGLATLFGQNLLTGVVGVELADGTHVYKGTTILVGGRRAPLVSVANIGGAEQISFQTPFEIGPGSVVSLEVENNGRRSSVADVPVFSTQPGIFEVFFSDSTRVAALLHSDYSLVTPTNPARRGEVLSVWLTGLGAVSPPVATGDQGPTPAALVASQVAVGLDNIECEILFAGYAPGLRGVYQINFVVAQSVPQSNAVRVNVRAGGAFSQYASTAVN